MSMGRSPDRLKVFLHFSLCWCPFLHGNNNIIIMFSASAALDRPAGENDPLNPPKRLDICIVINKPSVLWARRVRKFDSKFVAAENAFCKLTLSL